MSSRFKTSLLAGIVTLPMLFGGCKSNDFHESPKNENGTVEYNGRMGVGSVDLKLTTCVDGILLGDDGGWPVKSPVIRYIDKKSTFVRGEPIEFWMEGEYGIGRTNFRAELSRDGQVMPERMFVTNINPQWVVVPYLGLETGNYTVACYSLNEFLGKIDFEVVAPPINDSQRIGGVGAIGANIGAHGAKVGGAGAGVGEIIQK